MNITLYQMTSDPKKIGKTMTATETYSNAVMRDVLDVVNPVFRIASAQAPTAFNYLYCDYTGRYYFADRPVEVRNGLYEISCRCDVLETYKSEIKAKSATITRNENVSNGYLMDGNYKALSYRECVTREFPNAMDDDCLILITVG